MENFPKISIIIPVYNAEKYIEKCLKNLKDQTFKNFEAIIIDDGSTDSSDSIYIKFVKNDRRFKFIKTKNCGVAQARNTGLNIAKGKYVIFIDSDDWMPLDALEILYTRAEKENADLTLADVTILYEDGQNEYVHIFRESFTKSDKDFIGGYKKSILAYPYNPFPYGERCTMATGLGGPWNKLIIRSLLIKNQIKYESCLNGIFDDCLFILKVLNYSKTISYIQSNVYYYRVINSSELNKYRPNTLETNLKIFDKIREYISEQCIPSNYEEAYNFYVVRRFDESLRTFFFSKKNPDDIREKLRLLKTTILAEPYKSSFKNVNKKILHKSRRIIITAAENNRPLIIWMIYTLKRIKLNIIRFKNICKRIKN